MPRGFIGFIEIRTIQGKVFICMGSLSYLEVDLYRTTVVVVHKNAFMPVNISQADGNFLSGFSELIFQRRVNLS